MANAVTRVQWPMRITGLQTRIMVLRGGCPLVSLPDMTGSVLLRDRTCTVAAVSALLIHVSELSGGRAHIATMCPVSRRAFLGSCLGTAGLLLAGPARAQHDDDDDFGHHHDHDRA